MTYHEWTVSHGLKHQKIVQKLEDKNDDEVIEYFLYENMKKNEPNFCVLYAKNKKCHDIKNLNCYLCACPNFRFEVNQGFDTFKGKKVLSCCSINSKKGKLFESTDVIHQDCSDCVVPHKKAYIKKVFNRDWSLIMKESHV